MQRRIFLTLFTSILLIGLALWSVGRGVKAKAGSAPPATPVSAGNR